MLRVARGLPSVLILAAACGRLPLPGPPRPDAAADLGSSESDASQPAYRESIERFSQIAAGPINACGVTTDGRVRCWGYFGDCRDLEGECPAEGGQYIPKRSDQTAKRFSAGYPNYMCVINASDSIDCWGSSFQAPPAHIEGTFSALAVPYAIRASDGTIGTIRPTTLAPPDGRFVAVSGNVDYCGLRFDGTLACWGSYRADGTADPPPGTFTQVEVTKYFGCALAPDLQATCWGLDPKTWETDPQFTPLPGGTFVQLAAAAAWACGVRPDGSLACWGALYGFAPPSGQYLQVTVGTSVVSPPDYADAYFCALRSDGIAVCWGANAHGESSPP